MNQSRRITTLVTVIFFALMGNCIGAWLYKARTGKLAGGLLFNHVDTQNNRYITIPVWFNFLPALLLGLLVKPHWVVSLFTGIVSTALQGNEVQKQVMEGIASRISSR